MSTDNVFAWSATPGSNIDVAGNGIQGSSNLSLGNDVFQNVMAQIASGTILRGTDIATASTLDFTAVGVTTKSLIHDLTGTVTVTAVTLTASQWRLCRAQGVFQITASATLIVNGSTSVNYTTTAGDLIVIFGYGSSTVRLWAFTGGAVTAATTSASGIVELATVAEALTGTDAVRAVTPAGLYYPTGHLSGATIINNAGSAANKIDVAAGTARDSTDTANFALAAAITAKDITVAWAVGGTAGLLDTGSVANTTYYVYLIKRVDTGVVDVVASTSASAPTLPTNYTLYRQIGYFVRASATNGVPRNLNRPIVEYSGSAPIFACRGYVGFNGTGTVAIYGSGNVSSITDNGTADYTVNFTTALADANYVGVVMAGAGTTNTVRTAAIVAAPTASAYRVNVFNGANTQTDTEYIMLAFFR